MSRRAKRRRAGAASTGFRWGRWVGALALGAALLMGGSYLWLRNWLHSEEFRQMLSKEVGSALGAEASFGAFRWDGTAVATDSLRARGAGLVHALDADAMGLEIGLGRLRQGVVEVRDASINKIDLTLDLRPRAVEVRKPGEEQRKPTEKKDDGESWLDGLAPDEVELLGLAINRSALKLIMEDGEASFSGTAWQVRPGDAPGSYEVEAEGGDIRVPWEGVPPLALKQGRFRYQDLTAFVTESSFRVFDSGRLQLSGEASLDGGGFSFFGQLSQVMANEVLPEDWKQRLEGRLSSGFTVSDSGTGLLVEGGVELSEGSLTALPVLDHLAAYGGNPRFRRLALDDARLNFAWSEDRLTVSGLELGSAGLIHLKGGLVVEPDDRLDGRFRLGLAPGTLARLPGAEQKVFLPGERGLLWADFRVSGTIDDPKEDLSRRLFAAAGERMFELLPETGERVLKFTQKVAEGDFDSAIDQGKQVYDDAESLIDQGKRLLDGDLDQDQAEEVVRQAEGVVKGIGGLLDLFADDPPEPEESD